MEVRRRVAEISWRAKTLIASRQIQTGCFELVVSLKELLNWNELEGSLLESELSPSVFR